MKAAYLVALLFVVTIARADLLDDPIRAKSREELFRALHKIEAGLDERTRADFSLGWTYLEPTTTSLAVDSDVKMTSEESDRLLLAVFVGQSPRQVIVSGWLAWLSRERWLSARRDLERKVAVPSRLDGFEAEARKVVDKYTRSANQASQPTRGEAHRG